MEKFKKAEQTKSGLLGLWEQGGLSKSGGYAMLIARKDGSKPMSIFSKNEKNGKHALVVVQKGYFVVEVFFEKSDCDVDVFRIDDIEIKLVRKNYRHSGKWEVFLQPRIKPVVEAALVKAKCRNCREASFVLNYKQTLV